MLRLSALVLLLLCGPALSQDIPVTEYSSDILPTFVTGLVELLPSMFNDTDIMKTSMLSLINTIDIVFDLYLPPPDLPVVNEDMFWGDLDDANANDTSIKSFEIQFKEERIAVLLKKLEKREKFRQPLKGAAFNYGMDSNYLNEFLDKLVTSYDFEARQAQMNAYPQYTTKIQGLDIHFYHIKPENTNKTVIPLLMLHGWPMTNLEYVKLFPYLTAETEYDFVFELVVPSLPGFGYSQGTNNKGLAPYLIGVMMKKLMARLGHEQFYIHSGDVGQVVGTNMMTLLSDNVLGMHTNYAYSWTWKTFAKWLVSSWYPPAVVENPEYIERIFPLTNTIQNIAENYGYYHEQATRPDTIGIACQDSPSALVSWMLTATAWAQNSSAVSEPDAGLSVFDPFELMDEIVIWWDAESITTSMRYYAERVPFFQDPNEWNSMFNPTTVPLAAVKFRKEITYHPDSFLVDKYPNLVYSRTLDVGGHFAAAVNPVELSDSIWDGLHALIEFNKGLSK